MIQSRLVSFGFEHSQTRKEEFKVDKFSIVSFQIAILAFYASVLAVIFTIIKKDGDTFVRSFTKLVVSAALSFIVMAIIVGILVSKMGKDIQIHPFLESPGESLHL